MSDRSTIAGVVNLENTLCFLLKVGQSNKIWKSSKSKLKSHFEGVFRHPTKIRGDPMPIIVLKLLYLTQFRAARRDQVRLSFNIENALEIWHSLVRLMVCVFVCGA